MEPPETLLTLQSAEPVLRIGIVGTLDGIQPATIQTLPEKLVGSLSFEALTYYDQTQQKLVPQLAESWEFSEDAYTLTFHLKEAVPFHNGKKLTPEAIKAAWEKNFLTGKNWEKYALIQDIVGSEDFLNGAVTEISGIQAQKNQLQITFQKPNTAFPYMVTHPLFWIADADSEEGIPAGTGPYIVQERSDTRMTLLPFSKAAQGVPKMGCVEVICYSKAQEAETAFRNGQIDLALPLDGQSAEVWIQGATDAEAFHRCPLLEYYLLGFHQGLTPFAGDTALRQAFNYMVDREKIIQEITGPGFLPAKGPIPQGLAAYRPQTLGYAYDPEQARSLLEQSNYSRRKNQEALLLTYHTGAGHRLVLEELQRQIASFGVDIQLREADWDAFCYQLPRMGYRFFRLSWQADYPDADDFLYSLYHSSRLGVSNYTGFQNEQVDQLLDQSRATVDEEERIHLQRQAEDIILDQAPQLWLFQRELLSLESHRLSGFEINGTGVPQWTQVHFAQQENSENGETS